MPTADLPKGENRPPVVQPAVDYGACFSLPVCAQELRSGRQSEAPGRKVRSSSLLVNKVSPKSFKKSNEKRK